MIILQILPKWCYNLIEDVDKNKVIEFIKMIKQCMHLKLIIPKYIDSLEQFIFWFNKEKVGQFPLKIKGKNKFNEFYKLYNILFTDDGLEVLKNCKIIPPWIDTKTKANQYLWLDFSTISKAWKESYNSFALKFNSMFQRSF